VEQVDMVDMVDMVDIFLITITCFPGPTFGATLRAFGQQVRQPGKIAVHGPPAQFIKASLRLGWPHLGFWLIPPIRLVEYPHLYSWDYRGYIYVYIYGS